MLWVCLMVCVSKSKLDWFLEEKLQERVDAAYKGFQVYRKCSIGTVRKRIDQSVEDIEVEDVEEMVD